MDYLVVGLGKTAVAVGQFLTKKGISWGGFEPQPQVNVSDFLKNFADVPVWQGELLPPAAFNISTWIVSPGVPLTLPVMQQAKERGVSLIGDIEYFARENKKPLLAVTGSNGKSTVVSLLEAMVAAQGLRPRLLGNIGVPVLEGLPEQNYDEVILELSSFQLETTYSLNPQVACVLNVTPDHLDRHGSMEAYIKAKWRIYHGAQQVVMNADDVATQAPGVKASRYFSLHPAAPAQADITWYLSADQHALCFRDKRYLTQQLPYPTVIFYANVLAALAIIDAAGMDTNKAFEAACHFKGLPHRLEKVRNRRGVDWYNDSKATNIGATEASIQSLCQVVKGKLVVILGGQAKGASFESLQPLLHTHARAAILLGEAKAQLLQTLQNHTPCVPVSDLAQAVQWAAQLAQPGDAVLLAPACASYDMFKGYADRGEQFIRQVTELAE